MAVRSMTGFGEGAASAGGISITVELSSVNRKQVDVNISLPRNLTMLDALVQGLVRKEFSRGRVSGVVRVDDLGSGSGSVKVNDALAAEYAEKLRAVAKELKVEDNLSIEALLRMPGVVELEQGTTSSDKVSPLLEKALDQALKNLSKMRATEGRALEQDIRERFALLEGMMKSIKALSSTVVKTYREKLFLRLEGAGLSDLAADERIVKEIALFADRCDVSEELTRLKSHLSQGRKLLRSAEPVGRILDFLCQELFREINTIGSKANEVEITRLVVAFKTELERIREQVQNIE